MKLRPYKDSDNERLVELHRRMGFKYDLPKSDKFCVQAVLVDDDDMVQLAVFARPTVELYLLADTGFERPGIRLEGFKMLHEQVRRELDALGYEDANAWIPPQICKSFGRRLVKLFGWRKNLWPCFSHEVRHYGP